MEQKGLDEINESFLGEEILEEVVEETVEEKKEVSQTKKASLQKRSSKTAEKKAAQKSEDKKAQKIVVEPVVEKPSVKDEIKIEPAVTKQKVETVSSNEPTTGLFQEASTWKALTGLLLILFVFSIFTSGFTLEDSNEGIQSAISLADAEAKALGYVNSQLLRPPFTAELTSSEEMDALFKVSLNVAGQDIDSYVTKDGELFFPQGFLLDEETAQVEDIQVEAENTDVVEVSIDDDAIRGDVNAPVTIVEFSDFQCPFCEKFFTDTLPLIQEEYIDTGKVRLIYRDFPLSNHPEAALAAVASECADEQGKYWEYHDLLFQRQSLLAQENFVQWAEELGLNSEEFTNCLTDPAMLDEIEKDLVDGQRYGVTGTPAFFVNGVLVSGAQPFEVFKQAIDTALAAVPTSEEPVVEVVAPEEVEVVEVTEPVEEVIQPTVVEVNLAAKKWLFTPREITVNEGDTVQLTIVSEGLDFTFGISELGVSEEVFGTANVEFIASQRGEFEFACNSCEPFRGMTGTLVIE